MRRDERGYIVVETIAAFVPFIILMVSILSLMGLSFVHIRVHHALTQTASQISMYGYVFRVSNAGEPLDSYQEVSGDVVQAKENTDLIVGGVGNLKDLASSLDFSDPFKTYEAGKQSVDDIKTGVGGLKELGSKYTDDLGNTFELLLNAGVGYGMNEIVNHFSDFLFKKQFQIGEENFDFFNKKYHVKFKKGEGDPVQVEPISYKNNVLKLKVSYSASFSLGRIVLPFEPKLDINQQVQTKLWIGKGDRYVKSK